MNRLRIPALLAAGATVTGAGTAVLAVAPADAARTRAVTIEGLAFSPATVRVKRGDTVVWRWRDGRIKHDVRARGFRSSKLKSKGTHRVRFTKKGTFRYVCTVHGTMRGKVVVR